MYKEVIFGKNEMLSGSTVGECVLGGMLVKVLYEWGMSGKSS